MTKTHLHTYRDKKPYRTGVYKAWVGMRRRCRDTKEDNYPWYGGRGISVCERWQKFENFYQDMGDRPEGMSLDRINSNGNYEPRNCRWADWKTQSTNKRVKSNTRFFEFNGKRMTIPEWAKELGANKVTLYGRLYRGWPIDKVLTV